MVYKVKKQNTLHKKYLISFWKKKKHQKLKDLNAMKGSKLINKTNKH